MIMSNSEHKITKTPGVCGGDACLAGTRYTVWGFLESRRQGLSDEDILRAHPKLTQADLNAAWDYYHDNPLEIERALWENEACMIQYDDGNPPIDMIRRGRQLGLTEAAIQEAFEPPLSVEILGSVSPCSSASTPVGA
jgi:uncharacterized protein (DUF433 family)